MTSPKPKTIDEYIGGFPAHIQILLEQVRETIRRAAPRAREKISYAIPTFYQSGNLVHFAAFKNHIGLYAIPTKNEAFAAEMEGYKTGSGSVQFPLNKPIPFDLIERMVKYRVKENLARVS